VQRAREEIIRCDVELRRLHTSIVDEARFFQSTLQRLASVPPTQSGPVYEYITRRTAANTVLMARIRQTQLLKGFTGWDTPGVRKGTAKTPAPPDSPSATDFTADDDDDTVNEEDDEVVENMGGVIDWLSQLSENLKHMSV
jgi:hypothetical protein